MSKLYKKLVKKGADAYMRKLFEIGWLDEWSVEEAEFLHESLRNIYKEEPDALVCCLGEYALEPEGVCTPEAYINVVIDILERFGIAFEPDSISAAEEGGKIVISVSGASRRTSCTKPPRHSVPPLQGGKLRGDTDAAKVAQWRFKQTDDWMHDDFIDFINDELLPVLGEKKVFHPLPPASASVELVFHYPEIIEKAVEEGVIPDDDFFLKD